MSPRVSLGLPSVMSSLRMFTSFTWKRSNRVKASPMENRGTCPHPRRPQGHPKHSAGEWTRKTLALPEEAARPPRARAGEGGEEGSFTSPTLSIPKCFPST